MNLAVIGSGGREHAICYKLKQSTKIKKLICIPGNAGTKKIAENIKVNISDFDEIYKIVKEKILIIVIVGPEEPLVNGIVEFLLEKEIKSIWVQINLRLKLEGSKAFMKNLCKKNNIPTANFGVFENLESAVDFLMENNIPIVVKPMVWLLEKV